MLFGLCSVMYFGGGFFCHVVLLGNSGLYDVVLLIPKSNDITFYIVR